MNNAPVDISNYRNNNLDNIMDPLAPIAPQFKASEPMTLILKEKVLSFSGDSSSVKDAHGKKVFDIDAKMVTLSQRRYLKDAHGNTIGQLRRKKTPGLHPTCYIGTDQDEKLCAVKVKGMLNITKCDADIFLGGNVIGEASGNWRAKTFSIRVNGMEVANIKRKTSAASLFLDADSYCIEIQRGVDIAFMTLITIALDELYHDKDE